MNWASVSIKMKRKPKNGYAKPEKKHLRNIFFKMWDANEKAMMLLA